MRPLLLPALLAVHATAAADTVVLVASRDNTLYEESPSLSNGSGERIFCGVTASGVRRRALVAFDVAGAVPAGSTITGARLVLNLSQTIVGPQAVSLRRVVADWGEGASDAPLEEGGGAPAAPGDATWGFRFFSTTAWTAPGGDLAPVPSATVPVDGFGPWTFGPTAAMTADVQLWIDDPAASHGWCLVGNEAAFPTAKRFDSRENADPAKRPMLIVDYCPPPVPYCIATPNSWGPGARIGSTGSVSLSQNAFALTVIGARPGSFGLFTFGSGQIQVPFGDGYQCIPRPLARLTQPAPTDASGALVAPLDFTVPPASGITAGAAWSFQFVYRDPFGGGALFNTSNGLSGAFCP